MPAMMRQNMPIVEKLNLIFMFSFLNYGTPAFAGFITRLVLPLIEYWSVPPQLLRKHILTYQVAALAASLIVLPLLHSA